MKCILAPILILTFLFPSLAYGLEMKDLVKRDGLYYKKFTDVPFTGKTTGIDRGSFKDGKKHGSWVRYFGNGQLRSKGNLKNGKRVGTWVTYFDNGQLFQKGTFKNGKKDGPFVSYYDNGKLDSKGTYKDDEKEGQWVFYSIDGKKQFETGTYKNGQKVSD